MSDDKGQSLIEVLVAAFVIALLTVGVMSVAVLSQRMFFDSERSVVALSIINERKEMIKFLAYDDVIIGSVEEAVVRNNQTYTLTTNIDGINDPLTAFAEDYKKVEIVVEWTAPSGAVRDSSVVTYITDRDKPKVCTSCELGLCDLMTGVCVTPDSPSDVLFKDSFTDAGSGSVELSEHSPEVGSGWVQIMGNTTLKILSGTLRGPVCSNEGVLYQSIDKMSKADYSFSVEQVIGNSAKSYNILAVRIKDVDNMYALKWNSKNLESDPGIYKRQGGVWTILASIYDRPVDDGSIVTLKVEGNTISMLDDGENVVSVEDNTFLLPGRIGIGMGAVITDGDTCASQQLDNIEVGLISGEPCVPGLLCSNGAICPLTRVCPGDTTILDVPDDGELCRFGQVCSSGALCSLSGVCPVQSCLDGTCSAGNACFNGFCYPWEWYNLTLESNDQGNPADSTAMECVSDVCSNTDDCLPNCQSNCQLIESDGFSGCGRWEVISECVQTWVPECRNVGEGGAYSACRGGYDEFGNCADLECLPVACPAPDPLVDPDRSWCANGEECNLTSSGDVCIYDSRCSVGEMCDTGSGACRTICPDKAECSSYWGGWAKGCSAKAIVAGPSDCVSGGGSCSGSAGDCSVELSLSLVSIKIENVDQYDNSVVLDNPVEVLEGDALEFTDVVFRVILTGSVLDTIMVRVDPQDGSAMLLNDDYRGIRDVLTFEPGGSSEQTVTFNVVGDDVAEYDENFSVVITVVRSIAQQVIVAESEAEVIVVNDDALPSPPPSPS